MDYEYDLFISFKNSTDAGLTEDRKEAGKINDELCKSGFKVFFSNTVLHEEGVANYMLKIQSALENARAILVVFSRAEYITSGWVAQEWMTFLNLLLKDPGRSIFVYSINNETGELPPFLRPYECFGNYISALSHIANCLNRKVKTEPIGIGKRDFLNAYWDLFGNADINDYIDKPMNEAFDNYPVYCLKNRLICGGSHEEYASGLRALIDNNKNPLASYLLSRYYRDIKHLDLALSGELSRAAFSVFLESAKCHSADGEIGLWVLSDSNEYDGAFFMCDVIHDVLDAYDVKTEIKIINTEEMKNIGAISERITVIFWSDVCLEIPDGFFAKLRQCKERILLVLNAFGETALPYEIRDFELFDNSNTDITRICRILLS